MKEAILSAIELAQLRTEWGYQRMSMGSGPDADGIDTEIDSVRWGRKRLGADDSDRSGF